MAVVLALVAGIAAWVIVQNNRHEGHAVAFVAPYDAHRAEAPHRTGAGCFSPRTPSAPEAGKLVWVDPDPTGATAVWQPGLNNKVCHILVTRVDRTQATAIARQIDASKPFPDGPISCPMDDGTRVDLYFAYAGSTRQQMAVVTLTGCAEVFAPGRDARLAPGLDGIEPQVWAQQNSAP
ncbi:hypothetical protein [Allobranchiibius sp. CTAmp26]|uniref:hypothetical protein n=1 Tax=Allobranchiibius sp. CTAmp26 TaxID=2815214 RepID=UPI001AA0DBAF|nr:hypothetical protein [Allobranchiibius sp. CTAmp26]MBO1753773.1 hypothetical protein [Allobranchiibius sp. CTAmp26]